MARRPSSSSFVAFSEAERQQAKALLRANSASDANGCLVWRGTRTTHNFGSLFFRGTYWRVHRLAYVLENGPLSRSVITRHSCGNKFCINLEHIVTTDDGYEIELARFYDRLWSYVDSSGDCWVWTGGKSMGYGMVYVPRALRGDRPRQARAHVAVWESLHGPKPADLVIRHTCDNRPCCNPDHLIVGTHQDNVRDAVERQRYPRGEASCKARLTEKSVREARSRHAAGETFESIAQDMGVHDETIRQAVRRITWKHIA